MNKYYVYGYFREDGTPYYIGKGCGDRAWSKYHAIAVPPRNRIRILADQLTNEEALEWEVDLISLLGRKCNNTGCLQNKSSGGDGGGDYPKSGEHKSRISQGLKDYYASDRWLRDKPKRKPKRKKKAKREQKARSVGCDHLLYRLW